MRNRHKALLVSCWLISPAAFAAGGKFTAGWGFFALSAKTQDTSSSISNPSAFHLSYRQPQGDRLELKIGYSILMADFSGSDLGYGLDAGFNYYPFTDSADESYHDPLVSARRSELWRPYAGLSFNQRNFQSVRNSYAGFGFSAGVERYYDEKMSFNAEARFVTLSGSNESEATETALLVGVVFKL